MKSTAGIVISLVLVLSLAVAVYAVFDGGQRAGGSGAAGIPSTIVLDFDELVSGSGAAGIPSTIVLDFDELVNVSELVVLGEIESSETITKIAPDTSQPVSLRGADQAIEVSQISFTVDEYVKGSGADVVTVTMPAGAHFELHGTEGKLTEGIRYVLFLFDPGLRGGGDFWGATYLTHGPQGIWQVDGSVAERIAPPAVLDLDDLLSKVRKAAD